MLVDTHCHLGHKRLRPNVAAVLERARAAGVTKVVCATGDVPESVAAVELARQYECVYCTAGVHPHEAANAGRDYLGLVEQLVGDERNVAIGEIGLDFHYDFSPRPTQKRIFAEQLALAQRLGKAAVIHTREAFEDTLAIVRDCLADARQVVFHSFTGDASQARRALDLGAMVSFSGIVTFKKAVELRKAAGLVPDDRIMIETDSPYLSPEPMRKMKINEPANVAHVAACLAVVRNTSPERVAERTAANAAAFFGLDVDPQEA